MRFNTTGGEKVDLGGLASLSKQDKCPYYTMAKTGPITPVVESKPTLKEKENNLEQLLLNAPDAVIVINDESFITFWNLQAEKIFGWTAEEVINQPLSDKI